MEEKGSHNDWGRCNDWGRFWASQNRPQSLHRPQSFPLVSILEMTFSVFYDKIRKAREHEVTETAGNTYVL